MRTAPVIVVVIAALSPVGPAHAGGALGKVVDGMKEKSGQDDDSKRSSSDRTRADDEKSSDSGSWSDSSDYAGDGADYSDGCCDDEVYVAYPVGGPATDIRLDFGLHRVDDSDGALYASVRASYDQLGIILSDTAYYEQTGMETLDLHIWGVGGSYRLNRQAGPTSLWISAGLAGATSDGLQLYGGFVGGDLAHRLRGAVGVEAGGRMSLYQDDIRGMELRVGVTASILRLGYRLMELNVGPPLHGPELGLALQF